MKTARWAVAFIAIVALAACRGGESMTGTSAVASKLAFTVSPRNATAGVSFAPAVAVTIEDSAGRPVPSATNSVTVVIDTGSPGLSGTTTVTAVNGVATFGNLSIQRVGSGYFLTASSGSLTRATSAPFAITPAAPAQLTFTAQPSTTWKTQLITPAVQVAVEDAFANAVPSATNAITIAIGTNPSGGTLGGTTTLNAANGVATFTNLGIDRPGSGYTLVASAPGLTGAATAPFTITLTPASIIVVSGNGQSGVEGCLLPAPLVVQVSDRNNQPVAGITVNGGFGTTGTNGQAQTGWVLAWRLGLQTRTASVTNVGSVTFAAYAGINLKGCH
jgi:hypothetical protein